MRQACHINAKEAENNPETDDDGSALPEQCAAHGRGLGREAHDQVGKEDKHHSEGGGRRPGFGRRLSFEGVKSGFAADDEDAKAKEGANNQLAGFGEVFHKIPVD